MAAGAVTAKSFRGRCAEERAPRHDKSKFAEERAEERRGLRRGEGCKLPKWVRAKTRIKNASGELCITAHHST